MPIEREEVLQMIEEKIKDFASINKADNQKVDIQRIEYLTNNKIDKRNIVDHTFSTTANEDFEHNFGVIPSGAIVIGQSKAATILINPSTFTTKRMSATSSVADNEVRFLIL